MGLLIPIILVVFCAIVIWRSVDGFTTASDYLGRNLSDGVKGATINAIASSMPELFTTMFFLFFLHDKDGFSGGIGTTAGSAIYNAMIIPAFSILAVIYAGRARYITVSRKVLMRDGIALIATEAIFIVLISGNELRWWHGMVLMLIYAAYVVYMLRTMTKGEHIDNNAYHAALNENSDDGEEVDETFSSEEKVRRRSMLHHGIRLDLESLIVGERRITGATAWPLLLSATLTIAVSCYLLVLACEWLGSRSYSVPFLGTYEGLDIPLLYVALIIAAAASSIPDTIISMKDAQKGNYDDAVANAMGSNMFDICFALGFPLFLFTVLYGPIEMTPVIIQSSGELRVFLLLITIVVLFVFISGNRIGLGKAYTLIGLYLLFVLYVVGINTNNPIAVEFSHLMRSIFVGINSLFYS
ncbi:MAG: sodium:calcium antiporter [Flavobacteriales bacterium]|nr:sodium:calcium antiporter [Flavobacteriales bacterium]